MTHMLVWLERTWKRTLKRAIQERGSIYSSRRVPALAGGHALQRVQLVLGIEGSDLVGLGQRRVVEHRVQEVIERAVVAHHRLADVHDLGCARPQNVHTQ